MNATCTICITALSADGDVCVTRCGHAFHRDCILRWIDGSKSCPHCRHRAERDSIVRVFFECRDAGEAERDAKRRIAELEARLAEARAETRRRDESVAALKARVDYLAPDAERCARTLAENDALANRLAELDAVRRMLDGTISDVETMLQSVPDARKLCTYAVILKRAIVKSEANKKNLQETVRRYEREKHQQSRHKTELVAKIKLLESSVAHYEDKCKRLKHQLSNSGTRLEHARLENELEPHAGERNGATVSTDDDSFSKRIGTSRTSVPSRPNADSNRSQLAVGSAYMSLKQNCKFARHNFQEANVTDESSKASEFYILQKNLGKKGKSDIENAGNFDEMAKKQSELETVYDGLGGHFKPYTISKATNNSARCSFIVAKKRKRS